MTEPLKVAGHLAAAIPGMIQERSIAHRHQRQRLRRLRDRRVVEGRPADRHQPALRRDRQVRVFPSDHLPTSREAHRANPFDKKSRSTTNCPASIGYADVRSALGASLFACSFSISVSLAALAASPAPEKVAAMP